MRYPPGLIRLRQFCVWLLAKILKFKSYAVPKNNLRCLSIRVLRLERFGFSSTKLREAVLKLVQIVRPSPLEISRSNVIVV